MLHGRYLIIEESYGKRCSVVMRRRNLVMPTVCAISCSASCINQIGRYSFSSSSPYACRHRRDQYPCSTHFRKWARTSCVYNLRCGYANLSFVVFIAFFSRWFSGRGCRWNRNESYQFNAWMLRNASNCSSISCNSILCSRSNQSISVEQRGFEVLELLMQLPSASHAERRSVWNEPLHNLRVNLYRISKCRSLKSFRAFLSLFSSE